MRKTLLFQFIDKKNTVLSRSSCISRIVILIILFSFNFLHSQQHQPTSNEDVVKITLVKGVKLYSSDTSFNEQVIQKKIIVENADLSFEKIANHKILIASVSRRSKTQNLAQQVKSFEEKKRKEVTRQIQAKIDAYEAKSKSFEKQDYQNSPSPSQFSSYATSKNYFAPSYNGNGLSKIYVNIKYCFVKRTLDYLDTQNYKYYNNKSLDFCFSQVYSVRPPPVLV